jgi:single-strand DNA-binding protein
MVNRVVIVGRLTRDPELRTTSTGLNVSSFTLAFDNRQKDASGNRTSSFVNCTVWNKTADFVTQYCHKGSQVCVDGRLQERRFQRRDGSNASTIEIVVENIDLLGSRNGNTTTVASKPQNDTGADELKDTAVDEPKDDSDSDEKNDVGGINLADDDLPF